MTPKTRGSLLATWLGLFSIVEEAARREADAVTREIERACEKALQGGEHGVLVQQASAGQWVIIPHESVPYGEIRYQQETRP
jgi:hypothetical protein